MKGHKLKLKKLDTSKEIVSEITEAERISFRDAYFILFSIVFGVGYISVFNTRED